MLTATASASEATLPATEIAWVSAYELPEHSCKKPKNRRSNEVAGQMDRFQRKAVRYARCIAEYQQVLMGDHARIVAIAKEGVPKDQVDTVVTHLKNIEARIQETGADVSFEQDASEIERITNIGSRPSI